MYWVARVAQRHRLHMAPIAIGVDRLGSLPDRDVAHVSSILQSLLCA
jgi:hypothetical protein